MPSPRSIQQEESSIDAIIYRIQQGESATERPSRDFPHVLSTVEDICIYDGFFIERPKRYRHNFILRLLFCEL